MSIYSLGLHVFLYVYIIIYIFTLNPFNVQLPHGMLSLLICFCEVDDTSLFVYYFKAGHFNLLVLNHLWPFACL